ncbi:MAG: secretin N-terminal domain-containing protein [Deinococcota bacterium]
MLASDAGMFFAQATDTAMQATAAEEPTLVEQLISIRVDNDVLVVTAPDGIIDQLERIITSLDAPSQRPAAPDPIVRRSYLLSNARAEELGPTLLEALTGIRLPDVNAGGNNVSTNRDSLGGARSTITTDNDVATQSTLADFNQATALATEEEVNIAADTRTNRLIITAPESIQAEVVILLEELDTPQRQVSIQVRIQEMDVELTRNLGVNWNGGIGNFSATLIDTGLNFVFDAQRALSSFNIGATLDAFERQNITRTVDDSTVMVLDNQEGRIQSGGTIFITLVSGDIALERTIPYGLQVAFLPQITGDGRINMQVDARIETLISETDNPNFLNIGTRNVTSTITLAPGQTVLLGGLLQNSVTETDTGVPLLQDIPVIGALFRQTSETSTRNDLVLVVTADIIE